MPSNRSICSCVESSYNSLITCSAGFNKTAIAIRGGWIGNYSGEIVGGNSVYLYSLSNTRGTNLPAEWTGVDSALCGKINRTGVLCGDCVEGYAPTTDVYLYQCVKCSDENSRVNWLWHILLEYVPLTVMFLILLFFNVDATSGAGNAFIFYAQMVTTVFDIFNDGVLPLDDITHNHTHAFRVLYQLPYGVWNMEFFTILAEPYCLSNKIGTYGVILINYVIALYPIVLIVFFSSIVWFYGKGLRLAILLCKPVYKCILYIQRKWEFRRSMVGVFATFITMSYTKMLSTSFRLIMPTDLYDSNDRIVHRNIPMYNGNVKYTDPDLIIMYISAIVTLFVYVIVLPFFLVTPSVVRALHRRTKWEWLSRILPWGRLQEFLEGFHSCYVIGRNGQVDCRWFSGMFLVLRAFFFFAFTYSSSAMMRFMFLGSLCFVTMFVIMWTRPFKIRYHNTLNVGVFCILGIISCVNAYHTYQSIMWYTLPPALFWLEYLLLFLPLLLVLVALIKRLRRKFKKNNGTSSYLEEFYTDEEKRTDDNDWAESRGSIRGDDPSEFLRFTEQTGRLKRNSREITWYISSPSPDGSNGRRDSKMDSVDSLASTIKTYGSTIN